MSYYIYAHSLTDSDFIDDIFYIGKGVGDRARRKSHRNNYWNHTVAKNDGKFYVKYLQHGLSEEDAFMFEKLYIEIFGKKIEGGLLVNLTDGGEGASGHITSEETKRKISAAHIGKIISEEAKQKLRIRFTGENNHRYGKKLTDEVKKKISLANNGRLAHDKHWNWKGTLYQYDKNWNLIGTYRSSRDAHEITGINAGRIRNCASKRYGCKTAGGYFWVRKTVE